MNRVKSLQEIIDCLTHTHIAMLKFAIGNAGRHHLRVLLLDPLESGTSVRRPCNRWAP